MPNYVRQKPEEKSQKALDIACRYRGIDPIQIGAPVVVNGREGYVVGAGNQCKIAIMLAGRVVDINPRAVSFEVVNG